MTWNPARSISLNWSRLGDKRREEKDVIGEEVIREEKRL